MAIKGTALRVKLSTDGGTTFNDITGLNDASVSFEGSSIDVSEFGTEWVKRIIGAKDASVSASGQWKPGDTTGQAAVKTAWFNGDQVIIRYLPDGLSGFQIPVVVASFELSDTHDGVAEVSFEFEGADAATEV